MTGVVEWRFERGGGLPVYSAPERAGRGSCTLIVSEIDEMAQHLHSTGLAGGRGADAARLRRHHHGQGSGRQLHRLRRAERSGGLLHKKQVGIPRLLTHVATHSFTCRNPVSPGTNGRIVSRRRRRTASRGRSGSSSPRCRRRALRNRRPESCRTPAADPCTVRTSERTVDHRAELIGLDGVLRSRNDEHVHDLAPPRLRQRNRAERIRTADGPRRPKTSGPIFESILSDTVGETSMSNTSSHSATSSHTAAMSSAEKIVTTWRSAAIGQYSAITRIPAG